MKVLGMKVARGQALGTTSVTIIQGNILSLVLVFVRFSEDVRMLKEMGMDAYRGDARRRHKLSRHSVLQNLINSLKQNGENLNYNNE
ncbi:hypothetical protein HU200_009669 [Digitaria exilis]|uniref:Uncharacterized protein n=1 Tax=Digitaria exilis TaxID=1010633 RepID=A0A835FJH9_9POAL|nr:hypothetical protein HU200_009669 [Digitaria exilis]